jgi:dihydrofolate reductase
MRRVRYSVAMSLDGYIAAQNGEIDWITTDPEIDFAAKVNQFDTILVGRRTFEEMVRVGQTTTPGMKTIVFSRTLQPSDHPEVTIMAHIQKEPMEALKASPGKDIWLFGGGSLFRGLSEAGLVDTVEVSIIPTTLGAGVPVASDPLTANRIKLTLTAHKIYKSGIVSLEYAIA